MNIAFITIDSSGQTDSQPVEPGAITLPVTELGFAGRPALLADRIYIRPDWPSIGSPAFDAQLRAWHANNNRPLRRRHIEFKD